MGGDGISYESLSAILESMKVAKWAAENVVFGSGGALLQKMDRDTQKCAFKCCEIIVDGKARPVYKDPITDPGKRSKQGRLKLAKKGNSLTTLTDGQGNEDDDLLVEVFNNGVITETFDFASVRSRAERELVTQIFNVKVEGGTRPAIEKRSDTVALFKTIIHLLAMCRKQGRLSVSKLYRATSGIGFLLLMLAGVKLALGSMPRRRLNLA